MRFALMGLVTAFAVLVFVVPSGDAQSFFSKRYCTFGGNNNSGEADCSYNTMEQCRASASGLGRYCGENPHFVETTRGDDRPGTPSKRKSQTKRNP
jgi:Protein of unknown function (DUF3551)